MQQSEQSLVSWPFIETGPTDQLKQSMSAIDDAS